MLEGQLSGVEALAGQSEVFLPLPAVHRVAQHRVPDIGHVNADLMGAAGFQAALDVGVARITLQHLPMGHRSAAIGCHGHPFPVSAVASDGSIDSAGLLSEVAYHDGLIGASQRVVLELLGQAQVGHVVFRRDDETAGIPVDAVDDAWPQLAVDAGEGVAAGVEQGVDQGAVRVTGGGVYHHAHRFVDHDDILILIDHIQRDVLGQNLHRFRFRQLDGHGIACRKLGVFLRRLPVHRHQSLFQQLLCAAAGEGLHRLGKELVGTLSGLFHRQGELTHFFRLPRISRFPWTRSQRSQKKRT